MAVEFQSALREAGLNPPLILTLAITDDCNLSCEHCWVEARPQAEPTRVPARSVRRLVEEFAELGGEGIRLTGGEPLLHPDWLEFLEFACFLGLQRVEVQTNALLLGAAEVDALGKLPTAGLKLQVSLDGARAATHDRVRGTGSFAGALAGIRRLATAGLAETISIFFTEMAHNLAEFPEVLALAADLGVGSVFSGTLVTGGRAASDGKVSAPVPNQYLALLKRYREDPLFQARYAALGTMAALEWWHADPPARPCCSPGENPYLSPRGLLYPCLLCHNDTFAVAGAFERPLVEVFCEGVGRWAAMQQLASRRAEIIPACRVCPEKAMCAGGCVGRAWGSCGDLLAVEDRCAVRRLMGREKRFSSRKI
jgi:radical SAM protein with 4Fe4S-binding SPASM domain